MAQKIGIWGCLALGLIGVLVTFFSYGFEDPVRYMGGVSLILFGIAFWLVRKNAELAAEAEAEKTDKG